MKKLSSSFAIFFSTILMLILGCGGHQNYKYYPIEDTLIYLPLQDTIKLSSKNAINFSNVSNFNDTLFWTVFDWNSRRYHVFDLYSATLLKSIDLSGLSSTIVLNKRASVSMISRDTIAFFSDTDQKLLLINFEGEILAEIITNGNNKWEYIAVSYFDRDFCYADNKMFFINAYVDILLNSSKAFKEYYSRPMELVIDLSKPDFPHSHILMFHSNYRNGNFYGQTEYFKCTDNEGNIVHSFPANDSLFIYPDTGLVRIVYAGSKYDSDKPPYDLKELKNNAYLRKYILTNPFYQKIVFDPYRNIYYRAFKKKCSYLNESGTIRRNSEIPWSLIVLDTSFSIIGEIDFNPSKYSMSKIIPARDGLIVSRELGQCITGNQAIYALINIDMTINKMKEK